MYATADEVALIYARACMAWYGKRALRVAKQQVLVLQGRGDKRGVEAWSKVAEKIAQIQSEAGRRRKSSAKLFD
jgi:hypothetical protein